MKKIRPLGNSGAAGLRKWFSGRVQPIKLMTLQQQVTRGTVYFRGAPSHFDPVVRRTLNWQPEAGKLTYSVAIDVVRSLVNREPTYRIDYMLVQVVARVPAKVPANRSSWLWWLYDLLKWPAAGT